MILGVISDTHIPGRARYLPGSVVSAFLEVDAILHAGDLVHRSVLDELNAIAPTYAVLGNCDFDPDLRKTLKDTFTAEFANVPIGMIHNSGDSRKRRERLSRMFSYCRVVIFGHSHMPMIEDDGNLLLLNPGSACDPRRARIPTIALLDLTGEEPAVRLVELSENHSR